MTREQRQEIRKRVEAATRGDWEPDQACDSVITETGKRIIASEYAMQYDDLELLGHSKRDILALLDALDEREWISVKDRLPDIAGTAYLVLRIQNPIPTARLYRGDGLWHSSATVTYWQPLPAPPHQEPGGER
jgi:hypothetical protein